MTNYGALHKPFDSLQVIGELHGWLLPLHAFSSTLEIAVHLENSAHSGYILRDSRKVG